MRTGLARTAVEVAQVRAEESSRPDRLFDDPDAAVFLRDALGDEAPQEAPIEALAAWQALMRFNITIRTRFFDDYLLASAEAGCTQVVLVGAGLDCRAQRLSWPEGTSLYELDLPEVLEFKDSVLAAEGAKAQCHRVPVAADLREKWEEPLLAAGFDPTARTVWLAEGLLIYLDAEQAADLLGRIGALSVPQGRITFEHAKSGSASATSVANAIPELRALTALTKGGLGEQTLPWLEEHGWQTQTHDRETLAASYGRPVDGRPNGGLVSAIRIAD